MEIGELIGLSQAQVARLYNNALNMLRFRLRFLRRWDYGKTE